MLVYQPYMGFSKFIWRYKKRKALTDAEPSHNGVTEKGMSQRIDFYRKEWDKEQTFLCCRLVERRNEKVGSFWEQVAEIERKKSYLFPSYLGLWQAIEGEKWGFSLLAGAEERIRAAGRGVLDFRFTYALCGTYRPQLYWPTVNIVQVQMMA